MRSRVMEHERCDGGHRGRLVGRVRFTRERTMPRYKYLIVGSGMTADAAIDGVRQIDPQGSIGMIGAETHLPYNRPPLSKALWKGQPVETIWRRRREDPPGVTYHRGRTVLAVNSQDKSVVDDQGTVYQFERLLLATGGTPRRLPFGADRIIYYRTLDDYQRLRSLADRGQQFSVIGGGFIGSEVAAALAMNGKKVVMLFPEAGIGARIFPLPLAHWLNGYYREKGVEVLAGEQVTDLALAGSRVILTARSGREVPADGVVAGIGIQPNTGLAKAVGLQVDNGILIDESLRTQHEAIYAAGDVANFYSPALGTRLRVEHEDNANMMGQAAGRAMAGEVLPYHHLPFFYSDLFELSYEAVGDVDARLETVVDWEEPYRKGVVYYRRNGRVSGVLLWNTWGQLDAARALIAEPGPFSSADLKGQLPVR